MTADPKVISGFFRRGFFHMSIPLKLLLLILPLVCIPIILVGYRSFQTSVESVTKLSRELQLLQAKNAAREIDAIFETAFNDLDIMTRIIGDLLETMRNDTSPWEVETFDNKIRMLMKGYFNNSPYYLQFRFVDVKDGHVFTVRRNNGGSVPPPTVRKRKITQPDMAHLSSLYISPIVKLPEEGLYCIHLSKPVPDKENRSAGAMVIDLKYTLIMALVKGIRIGDNGYAFLVDKQGRTIAHPTFAPYEYDLTRYEDPSLREFIIHILSRKSGWETFFDRGEKAAAFAPVPAMDWSLAVSIPIHEFKKEARVLRFNTMQLVVGMVLISTIIVIFLSFRIIHPIRNLVMATKQVASGDLSREIPVESHDELGLLTASFNRMIRSLRDIQSELVASEKLISMGRLSAGVAHEIRNPLNAIKGAVTYLQRRRAEDSLVMEYSAIIGEEVERLSEFVTEFLLFARQADPRKSATDINALIKTVSTLFESEFQGSLIHVIEHLDPSLPQIMVDSQQLEQVFLNLFINAGHAMKAAGGELRITTRGTAAYLPEKSDTTTTGVRITIEDSGSGINPEDLELIFDPFYSTKESGTGLGLPISLSIVENHGGRLRVSSIKDRGTTITIDLPVE